MFSGVEGIIAVGMFSFISGIVAGGLEKQGRKEAAQNVTLITRIIFWMLLIPQLYMWINGMCNMFGIRYFEIN